MDRRRNTLSLLAGPLLGGLVLLGLAANLTMVCLNADLSCLPGFTTTDSHSTPAAGAAGHSAATDSVVQYPQNKTSESVEAAHAVAGNTGTAAARLEPVVTGYSPGTDTYPEARVSQINPLHPAGANVPIAPHSRQTNHDYSPHDSGSMQAVETVSTSSLSSVVQSQPAVAISQQSWATAASAGPSARTPGQNPLLTTAICQAEVHNRQGIALTARGAYLSGRSEFVQALRLITEALDAQTPSACHSEALTAGIRALEEAEDLSLRGPHVGTGIDLAAIVGSHQTPVLKHTNMARMTPLAALGQYLAYAQEQLQLAAEGQWSASTALHGLGKIHGIVAAQPSPAIAGAHHKALAFYASALAVNPNNYLAANDLAVLLTRSGQLDGARSLLLQSLVIAPQPTTWHNLAIVHDRLGETELARLARVELANLSRRAGQHAPEGTQQVAGRFPIEWVKPDEFAQSFQPSSEMRQPVQVPPQAQAELAVKPSPVRKAMSGLLQWNKWKR